MTDYTVSRDVAVKVLETVDAGLVAGVGDPQPGQMCVEAAVCYAMGLPHGDDPACEAAVCYALGLPHSDDPACVSRALRSYKIGLNDANWSSPQARAKGMRRLALAQLGSRNAIDDVELVKALAKEAQEYSVPLARRKYGASSMAAYAAAAAAAYAKAAADAAAYADAAANAARYAANAAAANAARYAARYAAYAAGYAANATYAPSRDKVLADHAERVVQILIRMNAPGCAFLDLAPLE